MLLLPEGDGAIVRAYRERHNFATIEHLRRRADGGKDHQDNLALACRQCNEGRGSVDWLTFTSWRRDEF